MQNILEQLHLLAERIPVQGPSSISDLLNRVVHREP